MNRSSGFSMVEVLVSIVILSVALLGTAGLMSSGLRGTNTAYYRSQATILADDIIDRMRANATAARNGDYNIDFGGADSAPAGSMAEFDVEEWIETVRNTLPGGDSQVVENGDAVSVTIRWDDNTNSFNTRSRL